MSVSHFNAREMRSEHVYFNRFCVVLVQEYRFVVTARDSASEPRIATASVLVRVSDIEDELPIFHQTTYEATVPENVKDYVVTTVKVSICGLHVLVPYEAKISNKRWNREQSTPYAARCV